MNTIKYIAGFLGLAILFTIVFVRAGQFGREPGGIQAGRIIQAGAQGVAEIIRAAGGAPN